MLARILASGAALLLSAGFAHAQVTSKVVASCGGQSYTVGSPQYPTMDTSGNACANASGSSVSGAVTIADGADIAEGSRADAAYAGSGSATTISALKAIANSALSTTPTTIQGPTASGATASGNPLLEGCRAATAAPTAVTDGQVVAAECGAEGGRVTRPYAIKELMVRGSTGAITGTTQTSIIASAGGSLKNYITAVQCANSGATTSILTFTDAAATVLINPAGGGGNWTFPVPLATAAATAFQVTPGSSSTSQYCSAQGYTGL